MRWLALFLAVILILSTTATATTSSITIISDQDITANITAIANGTAIVYVDGVPIKTEINEIWKQLKSVNGKACSAWRIGNDAWLLAYNNNKSIMLLRSKVDNNTMKIYLLRDELIGFENEYLKFKNSSMTFFENLNGSVKANTDNISELRNELNRTKQIFIDKILFLTSVLVVLTIAWFALIAVVVYKLYSKKPEKPKEKPKKKKKEPKKDEPKN